MSILKILFKNKYLQFISLLATNVPAQDKFISVASTTSTEQSGLFKHLLPVFEKKTGIHVRVVALGTEQTFVDWWYLSKGRRL
jgi:ABC-type tungstate transport system permease subunit